VKNENTFETTFTETNNDFSNEGANLIRRGVLRRVLGAERLGVFACSLLLGLHRRVVPGTPTQATGRDVQNVDLRSLTQVLKLDIRHP